MAAPAVPDTLLFGWWPLDVACARVATRRRVATYPKHVRHVVERCVSDVITDAVKCSRPTQTEWFITMLISMSQGRLLVEVWDAPSSDDKPRLDSTLNVPDEDEAEDSMTDNGSEARGTVLDEDGNEVYFEVVVHR